ncbi:MAG: hypothetical protein OHK0015_37550 [Chloroflexi bacterium OHK40]
MARSWLGVPLVVWGAICLAIAVVWVVVWPEERAAGAGPLRFFLMRWGHMLTWALLAAMCFLRASGRPELDVWGSRLGLGALVVYLAFLAASFVLR